MKRGSKADIISEMVNKSSFNPIEVGVELTTDHRYLVNEEFKTFLHFTGQLSRNFEKGKFDDRNEFACKCAKVMVDALKQADLYDVKYWENMYDEILNKSYD
jgi:hypothetical protein